MKPIKAILIGAGNRGLTYTNLGIERIPEMFSLVGVADPDKVQVEYVKNKHNISDEMCFSSWEEAFSKPKMADACIISTQDRMHFAPCMKAIELGYDILLEKPAAVTPEECIAISDYAKEKGVKVVVCHVLRYAPFFTALKKIIDSGDIGRVISIEHTESVGNVHQSHSYVRGNWRNSETSSPMILAKCCHDIDILQWLLSKKCTRVQSFGSLSYFVKENKPKGSPERCIDGCPYENECPYNTKRIYLEKHLFVREGTKKMEPTEEDIKNLITNTPYARCVYNCDNNVVDHQVVNMEYEDGETVSMTMSAFTKGGRRIHVMGTKGEIIAAMSDPVIKMYNFSTCKYDEYTVLDAVTDEMITGGHGGGDYGIIRAFCQLLSGTYKGNAISDISVSIENHLATFAAEESRITGKVVDLSDYIEKCRQRAHEKGLY